MDMVLGLVVLLGVLPVILGVSVYLVWWGKRLLRSLGWGFCQVRSDGWCTRHSVQMTLRLGKGGSTWYSHRTAHGWCKGR